MSSNKMNIKNQILLGYCVPILLTVLVTGFTYFGLEAIAKITRQVTQLRQGLFTIHDMGEHLIKVDLAFRNFIVLNNSEALAKIATERRNWDEANKNLKKYLASDSLNMKNIALADSLVKTKLWPWHDKIVEMRQAKSGEPFQDAIVMLRQGTEKTIGDEINSNLIEIEAACQVELDTAVEKQRQTIGDVVVVAIVGTLLGAAIAILAAFYIANGVSRTLWEVIGDFTNTSSQIAVAADQQEKAAAIQTASVSEVTSTMNELEASFQQVSQMAQVTSDRASQSLTVAADGSSAVQQTVASMDHLKQKVAAIAEQILRLGEQTSQIGTITVMVGDLANQTNLLALNAAVEAARAGEHGRGFAVVATEIRKLADQSKKSAEQIQKLVTDIQKTNNATVMVTEQGTKTVEDGGRIAHRSGEAFQNLVNANQVIFDSAEQTSLNVKQQVVAVKQVVEAMFAIQSGARETAVGIAQTKQAIIQIQTSSRKLQELI